MGSTENTRNIGNMSNIGEIRTNFEFIEIENEGREKEFSKNMCYRGSKKYGESKKCNENRNIWETRE